MAYFLALQLSNPVEDGRLVLLFADSQIRIVELRMDTLALQEATYRNMMGRRDAEDTTAGRTQLKCQSCEGEPI